jgi:putative membrane protein
MKRFDKGYIYSGLLTDFFYSLFAVFIFLKDLLISKDSEAPDTAWAIPVLLVAFAVIYLCFVSYRILYYRSSGYELTENEIKCKRGVFFRKRSLLEYKKIHAINKKQNLIHRIFGIAVLTVDSGSANTSHQAEITIIEKEKTVDALLRELNAMKENGAGTDEVSAEKEEVLLSDKDSLYSFTSKKKMLYTLINIVSNVFFTALIAVLAIIVIGICKLVLQLDFLGTWGQYFLYAILITVGAMLLLSVFSFIGCMIYSFVGYHNFTITKQENNIQISFGLLEKHTNTFSNDKIKAIKISQGIIQRMLGFATIKVEVIGYTVNSGEDGKNADLGILIPFCKYDEIGEILGKVLPDYIPDGKQTGAVSFFPFVSWFLLFFGCIAGLVLAGTGSVMMILNTSSYITAAVLLVISGIALFILALKAVSAALSYRTNGIAVNGEKITAYSGGFVKNITVLMARNLIAVQNVTTPLRKKQGIASLVMHLKTNAQSNEVKVHIQKDTLSDEFEKMLIL